MAGHWYSGIYSTLSQRVMEKQKNPLEKTSSEQATARPAEFVRVHRVSLSMIDAADSVSPSIIQLMLSFSGNHNVF